MVRFWNLRGAMRRGCVHWFGARAPRPRRLDGPVGRPRATARRASSSAFTLCAHLPLSKCSTALYASATRSALYSPRAGTRTRRRPGATVPAAPTSRCHCASSHDFRPTRLLPLPTYTADNPGYTADVLQSAQGLADHAARTGPQSNRIEKEDVELAIQMRRRYEFFEAPPRDVSWTGVLALWAAERTAMRAPRRSSHAGERAPPPTAAWQFMIAEVGAWTAPPPLARRRLRRRLR